MRVAIVGGAGGVGASTAFNLALMRSGHEIVLIDVRPEMITSHVMDFDQVLELSPGSTIRAGSLDDLAGADVVVLLSATPLTVGTSRLEYLEKNALIADELTERVEPGWGGVLVVVTNPVDPLVTRLQRRTGVERRRVIGYTVNDTLRLHTGLTKALEVKPGRVEAWALGEHGDLSVPLFDRVKIDGVPVRLTIEQRASAEDYFRNWYVRHVALDSGRSSTWTSGLGVARMIRELEQGEDRIWPASVVLAGEYGVDGVAISVPVTLGRGGAERIHEWELSPAELAGLQASAEFVATALVSLER